MNVTATHQHTGNFPVRAFAGRSGVWVRRHGDWDRPLHVWLYRGAWRVVCWPCTQPLQSGDDLYDQGWPTQADAIAAAHLHCSTCPTGATP